MSPTSVHAKLHATVLIERIQVPLAEWFKGMGFG